MRGILLVIIVASGLVVTLRFPFVGILLWQWISLMNPHKLVWGPLMTMPTAAIVAVTTIVSLLASREKKLPPLDGTTILFFLILLWMSVTTLFALAPWALVWDKYDRVWKMILFTLISYTLLTSRRRLEIFTWVVALSIAFFGVKGAIWTLIHGGTGRVYGPEHSMIGDNNDLGLALLLVQPLLFALRANHPKPVVRMALAGIIALNFFGIAFTYSRGALLGAAAIALFLVVKSRNKVGAASALVAVVVAVLVFAPANWYSRMETINSYKSDSSAMGRLYFWRIAIAVAETRPLVGGGFEYMYAPRVINSILAAKSVESLESARTAHSIWFESLGEHGVPGLVLFIALAFVAWRNCAWVTRMTNGRPDFIWYNNFSRMVQVSLIGYWVGGSFLSMSVYDGYYDVIIIAAALKRLLLESSAAPEMTKPLAELTPAHPAYVQQKFQQEQPR